MAVSLAVDRAGDDPARAPAARRIDPDRNPLEAPPRRADGLRGPGLREEISPFVPSEVEGRFRG